MKLAHFSDVHVTDFPLAGSFALKRLAAVVSYSLMGRGAHFQGSSARIASLLADVDAQGVDHALCTGDLTGVSTQEEFARVAALFGPRRSEPGRYTVIPGNHDRYVTSAATRFEEYFGLVSEGGHYPFVKRLTPDVSLVAIDVARPTSVIDSSGLVGDAQRKKLLEVLTDGSLKERMVVLALHYGLLRKGGVRDRRSHGLRDDLELMSLLDRDDVTVDLVLHGHMHRPYTVRTQRRLVICAGSATDLHVRPRPGYHVYELDPKTFTVTVARREWSVQDGAYVATPDSELAARHVTR
jgi:3',5'-cyclic AMP phosphodiesterase CpdA